MLLLLILHACMMDKALVTALRDAQATFTMPGRAALDTHNLNQSFLLPCLHGSTPTTPLAEAGGFSLIPLATDCRFADAVTKIDANCCKALLID